MTRTRGPDDQRRWLNGSANPEAQRAILERPRVVSAEQRLEELAIKPSGAPEEPFGIYVEAVHTGNLLFLTGTLPTEGSEAKFIRARRIEDA